MSICSENPGVEVDRKHLCVGYMCKCVSTCAYLYTLQCVQIYVAQVDTYRYSCVFCILCIHTLIHMPVLQVCACTLCSTCACTCVYVCTFVVCTLCECMCVHVCHICICAYVHVCVYMCVHMCHGWEERGRAMHSPIGMAF